MMHSFCTNHMRGHPWPLLLQESDIMRKLDMRRTSTVDMLSNAVNIGDYVTLEGVQAGQRPGSGAKGPQGGARAWC
jgi:hypothetical protein